MTTPRIVGHTETNDLVLIEARVNGTDVSVRVPARMTLADMLRDMLGLTGTHLGCEHGVCGMCTILVDGEATRACLLFACQVDGSEVVTVEGLGTADDLHPLQESFGRHHGLQCGFCTPGFLMSSYDLLEHDPDVVREDLPEELSGVICRCTGYRNIVDAVDDVAASCRGTAGIPKPKNCGRRTLVGRTTSGPATESPAADDTGAAVDSVRPDEIKLPNGEPTVSIEVTTSLNSSPDDVARVFADVRVVARCLPGAELTENLGDDWYSGRARVALGPVRLSFNGIANLITHESDRMHVLAQGSDASGGRAQAEIRLHATEEGTSTRLTATASVYLVGRIAGFGRSLAGDVSRRMFEDFASAVDRTAQGDEPAVYGKPPNALRLIIHTLRDRYRRARPRRRTTTRRPRRRTQR